MIKLTKSEKASLMRKVGYKNIKKRGLDKGSMVLEYVCNLLNVYVVENGKTTDYYLRPEKRPFRINLECGLSDWNKVEDIVTFVIEDITDYDNGKYWPNMPQNF